MCCIHYLNLQHIWDIPVHAVVFVRPEHDFLFKSATSCCEALCVHMGITIAHVASQRFIFSPKDISSKKVPSQDALVCTQILFQLYIGLKIERWQLRSFKLFFRMNLDIILFDDKFQLFFSVKADNRGILYQFWSKYKWYPNYHIYLYL